MVRTRITKLDMESPSEAAGEAFVTDGAGNVVVSGIPAEGHTHIEVEITDIEHDAVKIRGRTVSTDAPSTGQTYRWSGSEWVPSGVVSVDEKVGEIQEAGTQKATAVSILNFVGTAVNQITDEGGGKVNIDLSSSGAGATVFTGLTDTPSSYAGEGGKAVLVKGTADGLEFGEAAAGGTDLTLKDESVVLTPSGNSIDFTGSAVTATASGNSVTVDIPGLPVDVPTFIGTRYILATQIQVNTGGYWTDLAWDAVGGDGEVIYNEPSSFEFCPNGRDIRIPEVGYYNISVSVTISGASVPPIGDRNMSLNLFDDGLTTAAHADLRIDGVQTFHVNTTIYISDINDVTHVEFFNGGHDSTEYPYILSGAFTQMTLHKIQGSTIGIEGVRTTQINSGSVTISDDTVTDLDFEGEIYDLSDFWDTGDRATFTIPSSGYYSIQGLVTWDKWGGGTDRKFLIERNGTDILAQAQDVHPGPNDTKELSQTLSTDAFFGAGDTVKFRVWHNRGSSLNIIPGNVDGNAANASISKIGRP